MHLRENNFSVAFVSNPHIRSAEFQCTVLNVLNTKISGHPVLDKDKHILKQIGRCCDSARKFSKALGDSGNVPSK